MVCLLAFFFLALLSLFSATHRPLLKEAWLCLRRRLTLRPCETRFDEKIKARILGRVITRSPFAARFLNRYFELLSFLFFFFFLFNIFLALRGIYNYYLYGSCNGLNKEGFCLFDPHGENNQVSQLAQSCSTEPPNPEKIDFSFLENEKNSLPQTNPVSKDEIIFVGCYNCPYSRRAYPSIRQLAKKTKANLVFIHLPTKRETEYLSSYLYCLNQIAPDRFWATNDLLFQQEPTKIGDEATVRSLLQEQSWDLAAIDQCRQEEKTKNAVQDLNQALAISGIYGTPTIRINGTIFVGPKPERVYARALKK